MSVDSQYPRCIGFNAFNGILVIQSHQILHIIMSCQRQRTAPITKDMLVGWRQTLDRTRVYNLGNDTNLNLNNANIVPEAIHSHSPLQFPKRQVKQWWVLVCPLSQDESEKYLIAPTEIIIMGAFNVLDDRPSLSVSVCK